MAYGDRIKGILNGNNLSQRAFAERINSKQSTVSSWILDRNNPSLEAIKKIKEIFGVDLTGQAPTLDLENDCVYIKFYEDIRVSAGCGIDNHCEGYVLKKIDKALLNPKVNPAKHHAVRVSGDSMEPTFKDGDVIFVEPYNGDFANNRVYIIKRQDDVLVKRVKKSGDVFEVISDNKDYLPYTLSANEFQIIGRAV